MSVFEVKVVEIKIEKHPNAERLEIACVGEYKSIVAKGSFNTGDLAVYIPEQSILPVPLIEKLGLTGKLKGKDKNRVKAIRLRGVLSQGLCLPVEPGRSLGDDLAERLGIIKWEPPIPKHLAGEVWGAGLDRTLKYDLENYKKYPEVFVEGDEVVFTEKIHGSFLCAGIISDNLKHHEEGNFVVTSKGLGAKGIALKYNAERNKNNLYVRTARHNSIKTRLQNVFRKGGPGAQFLPLGVDLCDTSVYLLGEVFGKGMQDLAYGADVTRDFKIGVRVFDVYVGVPGQGRYLNDKELDVVCESMTMPRVPVLYRGPYSKEILEVYTSGKETVSGNSLHIREGVVVKPASERRNSKIGRVALKSVSSDYLCRKSKNATEYN